MTEFNEALNDLEDTFILMAQELQDFIDEADEADPEGNPLQSTKQLLAEFHERYTRYERAKR